MHKKVMCTQPSDSYTLEDLDLKTQGYFEYECQHQ